MSEFRTELLLPVGNMKMCLAAIHNGANAVYMGMPFFNARGRTEDFDLLALKEMIDLCHLYQVKVHLAFNVLIFEPEIPRVVELLKEVIPLGPDAIIVQDLGLVKIINEMAPHQVVHASTQMTISNHEAMEALEELSIERFVLARECSLKEIETIRKNTTKELEVFIHGALCVSYSGQCFTSEALGGRSANRGQCAQSCRFDYQLFIDGDLHSTLDKKYLVSPKDLCGLNEARQLQDLGIESLKVEGRLKSPEYVASAARSYQQVLSNEISDIKSRAHELSRTFSRGFFSGWLHGVDHQELVEGTYGNHRGLELGRVERIQNNSVFVKSSFTPKAGDGVLFANSTEEVGGNLIQVKNDPKGVVLVFDKRFPIQKVHVGMRTFVNKDLTLEKELKKSYSDDARLKKFPLVLKAKGELNNPLVVTAIDGEHTVDVQSDVVLEKANKFSLNKEQLEKELGSVGHTCFYLKQLDFHLADDLYLNNKSLKKMKKAIVEKLYAKRTSNEIRNVNDLHYQPLNKGKENKPKLNVLIREQKQLQALLLYLKNSDYRNFIGDIILDYEFGQQYEQSVREIQENGFPAFIATTRILKPHEYHNLRQILRCSPDGILVRNLGALNFLKKQNLDLVYKGDFSLNVTNSLTANFLTSLGLQTVCAGYDLNKRQLDKLLEYTDESKIEITIHQYMPEFHMEHCVFAAFLSDGHSFKDCGKPCEKHKVELVDMYGNHHYLKADQECRNTMFLAKPQSASTLIPDWLEMGVAHYRIEALFESEKELIYKVDNYLQLLAGKKNAQAVFENLGVGERFGVATGQLTETDSYIDNKK